MGRRTKLAVKDRPHFRIRRGDRVTVLSGRDKGHVGEVLRVDRIRGRVYVEGAMIQKVSNKATQMREANRNNQQLGGIIEREGPIHVSNVALIDPKDNKPTRVSVVRDDGGRSRRSARTGQKLD